MTPSLASVSTSSRSAGRFGFRSVLPEKVSWPPASAISMPSNRIWTNSSPDTSTVLLLAPSVNGGCADWIEPAGSSGSPDSGPKWNTIRSDSPLLLIDSDRSVSDGGTNDWVEMPQPAAVSASAVDAGVAVAAGMAAGTAGGASSAGAARAAPAAG